MLHCLHLYNNNIFTHCQHIYTTLFKKDQKRIAAYPSSRDPQKNIDRIIPDPTKTYKVSHIHNLDSDLFCLRWLLKYKSKGDDVLAIAPFSIVTIKERFTRACCAPLAIDCNVIALFTRLSYCGVKYILLHNADMRLKIMLCLKFDHFVDVLFDFLWIVSCKQVINLIKEVVNDSLAGFLEYVYFVHVDSVVADSRMWKRGAIAPLLCWLIRMEVRFDQRFLHSVQFQDIFQFLLNL